MPSALTDEQIDEIKEAWYKWEELRKSGINKALGDVAKEIGVSMKSMRKYKPDDIDVDSIEEMAKGKAEGGLISEVVKDVSKNATIEHERTLVVGKWCRDEYEDMAKAYGMEVEEFVAGAVNFWDLNREQVKQLKTDNQKYENYIKVLMDMLSKEEAMERVLNNAVNTSLALGIEINIEEIRKVLKLIKEEMM